MRVAAQNFALLSHAGRVRKGNEDACRAAPEAGVFVVCDGMGGAAAGEVASQLAADTFVKVLKPSRERTLRRATPDVQLERAIHAANDAVYRHSRQAPDLHGMGTTLVALLLEVTDKTRVSLTLAHVGDSRCYLFRDGRLALLTQDHSLVEEQVRSGELTPAEAEYHPMRNIITRAIGSQAAVEPEIRDLDPQPGDLYLLASDGLTRELADADIAMAFTRAFAREQIRKTAAGKFLPNLCRTLIDEANDAGGGDNISVLLLRIAEASLKE